MLLVVGVYGSVHGSVRQCVAVRQCAAVRQCVAVCAAVCGSARSRVRQCVAVCGSAHGSVWQCALEKGDPKGWSTLLITALGSSWEKTVPCGHYIYIQKVAQNINVVLVCPYLSAVGISPIFPAYELTDPTLLGIFHLHHRARTRLV